jgi:exopolysaccharide biosynthesis polyprenyl glycosylphosphotransferase
MAVANAPAEAGSSDEDTAIGWVGDGFIQRASDIPSNTQMGFAYLTKRVIDVVASSVALILCLPLILVISLLIVIDSRGPILFRQERIGKGGKRFTVLKFRSMRPDAEARIVEVAGNNEVKDGPIFKWRQDPRITRVGRFLRRSSLDELPQFWNVLVGDMSLVGPRPPLEREVRVYETWHLGRLAVIPGMTGLWQVSGRSNLTFNEMVSLDLRYVQEWSLWMDIVLILKTPFAVFGGRGAF